MSFDWNDYSSDSGTEDVPLLLSTRSQSLILAAMESLESRHAWVEVDDATWDDIHAAVGEAYEEIMEIVAMAQGTYYGAVARRTTNQNVGSPSSTWNAVDFDTVTESGADFTPESLPIDYITIPATGTYLIGANVAWQSNSSGDGFLRSSRLTVDGTVIARVENTLVSQQIGQSLSALYPCTAGQVIRLECFTGVPNLNVLGLADYSTVLWIERLR